jgi:signal transduction histidine kinase
MDRLRGAVGRHRREWLERWDRQLRAAAEAGFPLDGATANVLASLLDAFDRALERRFRALPLRTEPADAAAQRAAAQCSLLRDFLVDAIAESVPSITPTEEKRAGDALAHAAVEVLVGRALRREHERQRQRLARFARLAHELRNAATAAALAADLLRRNGAVQRSKAAALMRASLSALRDGIEDTLLDEALSAGGLRRSTVRLGPILEEASAELGSGVEVVLSTAPGLRVEADPRLVRPAVGGLFRAARQIAPPGATIRIGQVADRRKVGIAVVVHGHRLRVDRLPNLPSLSLARRAARIQGGSLSARLSRQGGCEFRLALPRVQPD